jgi:capsular polysaccharide biosynthesis protein
MDKPVPYPFLDLAAYAERAGLAQEVVHPSARVEMDAPVSLPEGQPDFYDLSPAAYDFPAVTRTTLREVTVRSLSNLLTTQDAIVRHELMDIARERPPEEARGAFATAQGGRLAAWSPDRPPKQVHEVDEAAVFTDGAAPNYAHWLTEVLPRVAAFVDADGKAPAPIVIDQLVHPNIRRSLDLIAPEARVYRVAPDHAVRVARMHQVSVAGYVPFKLRPQPVEAICHGLFGPGALRNAVGRLRRAVNPPASDRPKLFVRRTGQIRRLLNEPEIEAAFVARGFTAIEPETLRLEEQVALFSRARMVAGATGAGLINLAFCQPDCPVIVMMPRFRHTAYWYWRRVSAAAGAGPVVHVSGRQAATLDDPFDSMALQQDYRVELKDVLDGLDRATAL